MDIDGRQASVRSMLLYSSTLGGKKTFDQFRLLHVLVVVAHGKFAEKILKKQVCDEHQKKRIITHHDRTRNVSTVCMN